MKCSALLRTSLVLLKIPARLYNSTMHSARFYFFNNALITFWRLELWYMTVYTCGNMESISFIWLKKQNNVNQ